MAQLLLEAGADPDIRQYKSSSYLGRTALMRTKIAESSDMVKLLLEG